MALDKIVDSAALDAGLTQVADAIREKGEVTGTMVFPGGFVDGINMLQAADDTFRRWDITTSGAASDNWVALMQDDWLRAHRLDENLLLVMVPKFIITADPDGANNYMGVYVGSNRAMMQYGSGELLRIACIHTYKNTAFTTKLRKSTLIHGSGTDIGSLDISSSGVLSAMSYGNHLVAPGDYCVIAVLM